MKHLLKVTMLWTSIVYVICFIGLALFANLRSGFMLYALHTANMDLGQSILTVGTFFSGLVIWNVIDLLAVWLFANLYNGMK